LGEYDPLLVKDAAEKKVYDILLSEIPAFREVSSPWQRFLCFLSSQTREGGVIVKNTTTGWKKRALALRR